jgi:hypothetical protein
MINRRNSLKLFGITSLVGALSLFEMLPKWGLKPSPKVGAISVDNVPPGTTPSDWEIFDNQTGENLSLLLTDSPNVKYFIQWADDVTGDYGGIIWRGGGGRISRIESWANKNQDIRIKYRGKLKEYQIYS